MAVEYEFIDHTPEVMAAIESRLEAGLEACGIQCVSHAKQNITAGIPRRKGSWYVPKGTLRNSINHKVVKNDKAVYVGTNNEYAAYNEFGTGSFAEKGNGRKGWWVFVPGSSVKGKKSAKVYTEAEARRIVAIMREEGLDAHMTKGIPPLHFLKNAVNDHTAEYKQLLLDAAKT